MSYTDFDFPHTSLYESDLREIIAKMRNLENIVNTFVNTEQVKFADPIIWNITSQYAKTTVVLDTEGNAYLSKQAVPSGIQLNNEEYWQEIFNFTEYTRTANQNLTINEERNTTRATAAYQVDDWLIWNDVLYKVTSAIAIDDLLVVDTNIEHFTIEDFIKAFMTWATNTIQQYKNDIDASELAYRQQLAQDIASATASLQAQLDAAIAGATVDSEVINARVGYDNTTYNTLRDAIVSQIEDLYTALSTDDLLINNIHSLVDYNYQTAFEQSETPGGTWRTAIGIKRVGEMVTLNRSTIPSGRTLIRLNGTVALASTNTQLEEWTDGIQLIEGHQYKISVIKISGSSIYDSDVGARVPAVFPYIAGSHEIAENYVRNYGANETEVLFTATSDSYNIVLNIVNGKFTLTDAKLLIIITDLSISQDYYIEKSTENNENVININNSLIDYDFNKRINIPLGDSSTWNRALGVTRFKNTVILNKDQQVSSAIYVKLNGDDVGLYARSQLSTLSDSVSLISGHNYKFISELIDGDATYIPSAIVTKSEDDTAYGNRSKNNIRAVCKFTAEEDTTYNFYLYTTGSDETYSSIYTNAKFVVILVDETVSASEENELPYYYNDYIETKVAEIETNALNVTENGLRCFFITDYHRRNNTQRSPQLIKVLSKRTGIRSIVFGGDAQQSETTPLAAYNELVKVVNDFSEAAKLCKMYYITGNHEMNNPSANPDYMDRMIAEGVVGQLFMDQTINCIALHDSVNSFYHDNEYAKIRSYYIGCNYTAQIPVDTRRAIYSSLLEVPDGYTVIIFSHVGLEWDEDTSGEIIQWRAQNIIDMCAAMNDGTTTTIYLGPNSTLPLSCDFTGKQRKFIGMISGHTHRDGYVIYDSRFPIISTATDAYELTSERVPPPHGQEPGTIYEQCFDVIQIDNVNDYIYMTRIGDGNNRTFKYGAGAGPV